MEQVKECCAQLLEKPIEKTDKKDQKENTDSILPKNQNG